MRFGFAGKGFPLLSLPKTPSGIWFVRRGRIGASSGVMFAILHVLGSFACDLLKSRRRLQAENLFLRHQLNIALRRLAHRVWSKYWSEASISSIANLIALITVPVPHRRPG